MYIAKTEGENGVRGAWNHILHMDIEKRAWSKVFSFCIMNRKKKEF